MESIKIYNLKSTPVKNQLTHTNKHKIDEK